MDEVWRNVITLLGVGKDSHELGIAEMALRVPVVYLVALAYIKIGMRRSMGRATPFDIILGIMFGSVMSRAITGQSPFLPTLASGATLVAAHWIISYVALRSHTVSRIAKGRGRTLIKDGQIQWDEMRRSHIGEHDLLTALRRQGKTEDLTSVHLAVLERSGKISVIPRKHDRQPRIVDVRVESGVQTVRIEIVGD